MCLFSAKGLHGFDRCRAAGCRETGKKYSDHQKGCCYAISRRVKGRNPEQRGAQQTHGGNGAQSPGCEPQGCGPRATAQHQPKDSYTGGTESDAEGELAMTLDHRVSHNGVEPEHGD